MNFKKHASGLIVPDNEITKSSVFAAGKYICELIRDGNLTDLGHGKGYALDQSKLHPLST